MDAESLELLRLKANTEAPTRCTPLGPAAPSADERNRAHRWGGGRMTPATEIIGPIQGKGGRTLFPSRNPPDPGNRGNAKGAYADRRHPRDGGRDGRGANR